MKTEIGTEAFTEAQKIIDRWMNEGSKLHGYSQPILCQEARNSLARLIGIAIEAGTATEDLSQLPETSFRAIALVGKWIEHMNKLGLVIKIDAKADRYLVREFKKLFSKVTTESFISNILCSGNTVH